MLDHARLNGLSRVRRTRNAFLGADPQSGLQLADVTVGIQDLNVTADAQISLLGLRLDSPIILRLSFLEVSVKSYLNHESNRPILDDVQVPSLDGLSIDLPALGFAGSVLVDMIASSLMAVFRGSIKQLIRSQLLKFASRSINRSHVRFN